MTTDLTENMPDVSFSDFANDGEYDCMERARHFTATWNDTIVAQEHDLYKREALNGSSPTRLVRDGHIDSTREMIYLASNDYLNLTTHPKVVNAGVSALMKYGAGAGSVPLLGGTSDLHVELERKIARFKGCESAILYTSGFGSNSSTLLALLNKQDVAIVDKLAHASLIDGCRGTNARYFRHNDISSLERILSSCHQKFRTKMVVIDGVYSMDGDIARLPEIVEVAHHYNAYVMVDEAHATGVIGSGGRGTPEHYGLSGQVDIVCGTFSKALGGVGGFVASKKELIRLLHFYSRGYMFSTAMSPQTAGSLIAAIDVIESEPDIRDRLWDNIRYFKKNLDDLGFDTGNSETAVFPIIIGDDLKTKNLCRDLHRRNIYVNPVLFPAVPKRLARIRMSLMANHTRDQLDHTLHVLKELGSAYDLI